VIPSAAFLDQLELQSRMKRRFETRRRILPVALMRHHLSRSHHPSPRIAPPDRLDRHDFLLVLSSYFTAEDYEKYKRKIRSLGIEDKVVIHSGWLDETVKKSLFCASDVICLPSLYEPFGLVTLEGLAADLACENNNVTGPAVIVGATGGMNEIIRNGINGFKTPMDEDKFELRPDYLAKIIDIVLRNDRLHRKLSKGGAERVQSPYFDWNFIVLRMHEAYRQAIENFEQERKK